MKKYNHFIGKRCIIEMDPLRGIALEEDQEQRLNLYNGIIKNIDDDFVVLEDVNKLDLGFNYVVEELNELKVEPKREDFTEVYYYNEYLKELKCHLAERKLHLTALKTFDPIDVKKFNDTGGGLEYEGIIHIGSLILNKETINRIACIDDILEDKSEGKQK